MKRRTLIATLGSLGIVGGGMAVWQRHGIRRQFELDDLEDARDRSVPTPSVPLVVPMEHLEAAFADADAHLAETETAYGDDLPESEVNRLGRAMRILDDHPPEAYDDPDDDRLDILNRYRIAIAKSSVVRGHTYDEIEGPASDELHEAVAAVGDDLDDLEVEYRGDDIAEAIVRGAEIDDLVDRANRDYDGAVERVADDEPPMHLAWEAVGLANGAIADAERFLDVDGPDRAAALERVFDTLVAELDAIEDETDWAYTDDVANYASTRWMDWGLGSDLSERFDEGYRAKAVHDAAARYMVALSLWKFADYPARRYWPNLDEAIVDDSRDLVVAKDAAITAIDTVIGAHADDILAHSLLEQAMYLVDLGDIQVGRMLNKRWSIGPDEWAERRDRAYLHYLAAKEDAAAIRGVIDVVHDAA